MPRRARASKKNAGALARQTDSLIIRVRRANADARPTQIQIPFALRNFIGRNIGLHSRPENGRAPVLHNLVLAQSVVGTRVKMNTWKIDIPEVRGLIDPVLVLTKEDGRIVYEVSDAADEKGAKLKAQLLAGLSTGATYTTVPSSSEHATMCQFV